MNTKSSLGIFFKTACLLPLLFVCSLSYAQQDPQFTHYFYAGNFFNPSFAGKESGYHFSAIQRSQWQGYRSSTGTGGAPNTQLITAQGRINSKNLGYGLTVVNDQIGAGSRLEINLQGSYHKKINRTHLSIGGYLGAVSSSLNYEELQLVNPEPTLPSSGSESQVALDMGAGILIDRGNVYVGLSARHLNRPSFDFGEGAYANRLEMHNYLLLGYRLRPIGQLKVEPSVLIKSVGGHTISYELSVIATLQNRINGGIAYRGEESVSLILGYSLLKDNSLKLGYAFDLVVGGLEAKAPTSHELMLRYAWVEKVKTLNRVIQRTPRFRF